MLAISVPGAARSTVAGPQQDVDSRASVVVELATAMMLRQSYDDG